MDVILDSSSGANLTDITVLEDTKGQISTTHFTLMSEGVPAPPLPTGATTTQVRKYHDKKYMIVYKEHGKLLFVFVICLLVTY